MAGSLVRQEDVTVRSRAAPGEVFAALDEHRNLAAHMASGSLIMGGGGMATTLDERGGRAVGSRIAMNLPVILGVAAAWAFALWRSRAAR